LLVAAAVLIERNVPMWWLAAWIIWISLLTLDHALRPLVQTRLLYSAARLRDEPLAASIAHLLGRCGLRLGRVHVVDASRRTRRANASVHGLGRTKHIYLHDTLLERLGRDEVLAVVAHEAGHARHRHVLQHLAALALLGLAGAGGASLLSDSLEGSTAERLAMMVLIMPWAAYLVRPIMLGLSRRFEYEADAFAAAHVGASAMARALERLYAANAGVATSDPIYMTFHASHPAPRERLGRLWQIERKGGCGLRVSENDACLQH
jgi:STE24 endopeptidase